MSYCQVHGSYGEYYDGCPECRAAEERAEADRKETKEQLSGLHTDRPILAILSARTASSFRSKWTRCVVHFVMAI